jgi:tRNA(Ile)-lysidine synthase
LFPADRLSGNLDSTDRTPAARNRLESILPGLCVQTKIRAAINKHRLLTEGDTVIVAVSGGADSVALLDILASRDDLQLHLVVAHLNHALRGAESEGDEAFVQRLAAGYGLPLEVCRIDVSRLAREQRLSLEEAGRISRYRFFDEVAAKHGARVIVTAHHADDQAETVLMRLLRGSGASGLRAMVPNSGRNIIRPLLEVSRAEIEGYLLQRGLPFRTDSTNNDTGILRNRIRHELIPFLESYNPRVRERLAATATALARDEEVLEMVTDAAFSRHGRDLEGQVTLDVAGCLAEPAGVRLRLYRRAVLLAKGSLARINAGHLLEMDLMASTPKPHLELCLPDGTRVQKSYGLLSFAAGPHDQPDLTVETEIEGPGEYLLPGGYCLIVEETHPLAKGDYVSSLAACFDADASPFPWLVRTFRAGDRMAPFGMAGHKKVKDIFIDDKVPVALRRRVPLLFCGENLLWIPGVRRSGEACLTERTRKVVRAEIVETSTSICL